MNFEETQKTYPYLTYLVERLQTNFAKLSLTDKIELSEKISSELQKENQAIQRRFKLRIQLSEICENLKKTYDNFSKTKPARPLFKTGIKSQIWYNYLLKEQRYLLLMKDAFNRLEEVEKEKLDRKADALHFLHKMTLPLFDRVKNSVINEHIQQAAEFLREMKRRGINISAVDIPDVGKVRIK